ncbi:MAG: amino acid ABC transporter permease [Meiothermus sp.]
MSAEPVRSKSGLATKAAGSGLMLMGLLVVVLAVSGLLGGYEPRWAPLLLGLTGLFAVALGFDEGFRAEVEVSPDAVRLKKWGQWETYGLEGIEAVDLRRDWLGLGGLILVLASRERGDFQVNLRQYSNRSELARAILGAICAHNPEVRVLPRAERRFGRPPFGVG